MQKLLLVCVTLVLALGVTWYFVAGESGGREAARLAPAAVTETPSAPAPYEEPKLSPDDYLETARVEQPASEFAPALAAHAAEEPAASKVALTGRIVDPRGNPVAGAELSLDQGEGMGFFRAARDETRSVDARTDAAGRFRIETARRGAVRMHASASRHAPHSVDVVVHGAAEQALGDIALSRGVVLAGTVIDGAGNPVPGAKVRRPDERNDMQFSFAGMDSAEVVATTDERGRFEIDRQAVGPWRLIVTSADHPDDSAQGETNLPDEEQRDLFVKLADGTTIRGRVLGLPESSEEGFVVRASEDRGSQGMPAFYEESIFGESREAIPDASGAFVVSGLRLGKSYRLVLAEKEAFWGGSRSAPVTARSGDGGVELVYTPGTSLAFQVVDGKTGDPVTAFTVSAGVDWPMPLQDERGSQQKEHPEGRVRFEGLRPRGSNDQARLMIDAVGYERYQQESIRVGHQGEVDLGRIALSSMPVVRVRVRGIKTGEPVPGARVELSAAEEGGGGAGHRVTVRASASRGDLVSSFGDSESAVSDENGVATLRSMPGRRAEISVTAGGFATWKSGEIALPAAEDHDQEALLSRGGSARVLARDALGAALPGMGVSHRVDGESGPIRVSFGGGPQPDATTDEAGVAMFENLVPGRHLFQLQEQKPTVSGGMAFVMDYEGPEGEDPDAGWTEGWVAEGETAEIVLVARSRGSLAGTITEGGAPLAGARVRLEEEGSEASMPKMFPGESGPSARTDGEGRFLLDDLAAGDYVLVVDHDARAMEERVDVRVDVGENEVDVSLPVAIVEGRVTDEQGEPVAGAKVRVDRVRPAGSQMRFAIRMMAGDDEESGTILGGMDGDKRATTDAEGRYVLRGVSSDVELQVDVSHADYQAARSESFRLAADQVLRDRDVMLLTAGRIEAFVRRADGTAAAMSVVRADFRGETEDPVQPVIELTNREGKATLKSLRAGPWEVSLMRQGPPGDSGGAASPAPKTVEVKAGETSPVDIDTP